MEADIREGNLLCEGLHGMRSRSSWDPCFAPLGLAQGRNTPPMLRTARPGSRTVQTSASLDLETHGAVNSGDTNVFDGTGVNHGANLPPDNRNMVGANKFLEQQALDRNMVGTINMNEGEGSTAVDCKFIVKYRIMTKTKACRGCGR